VGPKLSIVQQVKFFAKVSSRIRADLLQRAGEFNIKLEDVSITHLTFGKVRNLSFTEVYLKLTIDLVGIYSSC
jgi:hypothetical protein